MGTTVQKHCNLPFAAGKRMLACFAAGSVAALLLTGCPQRNDTVSSKLAEQFQVMHLLPASVSAVACTEPNDLGAQACTTTFSTAEKPHKVTLTLPVEERFPRAFVFRQSGGGQWAVSIDTSLNPEDLPLNQAAMRMSATVNQAVTVTTAEMGPAFTDQAARYANWRSYYKGAPQ